MRTSILRAAICVAILALVIHSLAMGARSSPTRLQDEKDSTQEQVVDFGRPDPEGIPTKIHVGFYLIDLISIDDVNQSFEADFYVMARWNDPRLAITNPSEAQALRNFDINEIWPDGRADTPDDVH